MPGGASHIPEHLWFKVTKNLSRGEPDRTDSIPAKPHARQQRAGPDLFAARSISKRPAPQACSVQVASVSTSALLHRAAPGACHLAGSQRNRSSRCWRKALALHSAASGTGASQVWSHQRQAAREQRGHARIKCPFPKGPSWGQTEGRKDKRGTVMGREMTEPTDVVLFFNSLHIFPKGHWNLDPDFNQGDKVFL